MTKRTKAHVEYPLAKSWRDAVAWIKAGNECWQEDSNDFPACGGFDDLECFLENFPEDDHIDDLNFESMNIHLVPSWNPNNDDYADDFQVGEKVYSMVYIYNNGDTEEDEPEYFSDILIDKGELVTIISVSNKTITVEKLGGAKMISSIENFCRCVDQPKFYRERIFNLFVVEDGIDNTESYDSLESIKEEYGGEDISWSDDYDDLESDTGLTYQHGNWDIGGYDKDSGDWLYGVQHSILHKKRKS